MPTTRIGDIDIAYTTMGDGPPLVAIMGLTGSRHHWGGFAERFANDHRIVTFDNRGVGETSAPPGPYSTAQMAEDTLGWLDDLGIETAVIFGVSMGGMIAQELALRAPERVTKLVLGCTSFGGASAVPPTPEALAAFASIGKVSAEVAVRRLFEVNFSERFIAEHPEVVEELVRHGVTQRMSKLGYRGQLAAVVTHDTASRVSAIRSPTLLLTGDADRLIPAANSELLAASIPNARVVVLEGVGHMFWIEAPDAAEKAIREFLKS